MVAIDFIQIGEKQTNTNQLYEHMLLCAQIQKIHTSPLSLKVSFRLIIHNHIKSELKGYNKTKKIQISNEKNIRMKQNIHL